MRLNPLSLHWEFTPRYWRLSWARGTFTAYIQVGPLTAAWFR